MELKPCPSQVCVLCALMGGGRAQEQPARGFHGTREVSGEIGTVVLPRDYGYPHFPNHEL